MAELQLSKLNDRYTASPRECVRDAERKYHRQIDDIASYVLGHAGLRLLLIAGPSGSGKTTSANLIRDSIERGGERAMVVSLDNFYRDGSDPSYPRHSDGSRDYECPNALHLEEVTETLRRITEGQPFVLPHYDFKTASRDGERTVGDMSHGCVIVEGLHALAPVISDVIGGEHCYRLFVSVSTNIVHGGERMLSGRNIRFIRRMVRDGIYRAADAERTLQMWRGVLAAEDVYLYPHRHLADVNIDTFHEFELGVMRSAALGMIPDGLAAREPYVGLIRAALERVAGVDDRLVPENSLIREFISGGVYDDQY